MKRICCLLLLVSNVAMAQVKLPITFDVQKLYDKGTRSVDGRPGKNYWQNTANYTIAVQYDPITRLVSGTEEISYVNNSPDNLRELIFKLYPNLYQKGNVRNMPVEAADLIDGVNIDKLAIDGVTKKQRIDGTNMMVGNLAIASEQTVKVTLQFSYTLNKGSHIRTGEIEEGAAFIAYFFPRIAVYDDLDGWNRQPYLGAQEFYNDFCNFDVSVTVPGDYLVWATGDLQNCTEVLNEPYCDRISKAEKSDEMVFIANEAEVKAGGITKKNTTNTWKFKATNVVDFVFALSNHYVWNASSVLVDSSTGRRTRVDALFNTKHGNYFDVIGYARKTVELMSFKFPKWPFPYSHISVFDGLDQMEYPMMVNDNPLENKHDDIELTDHEIFHTMFPFYMGINETKYGWMDEGWATIGEWLLSPMIDSTIKDDYGIVRTERSMGSESDVPVTALTTMLSGAASFTNSYPKPAFGYLFVKDMLGDELFFKSLHFYIQQWNGKHPLPHDFFNCINTASGKNLNWFWKKWFYENGYADLAINKVINTGSAKKIIIESKGNKPVPVHVVITFADGSTQTIHRSIAAWEKGNSTVQLAFNSTKKIKSVKLGDFYVPDFNKLDNVWEAK
jgi:hypothetical protein